MAANFVLLWTVFNNKNGVLMPSFPWQPFGHCITLNAKRPKPTFSRSSASRLDGGT
jgi:hypothetical protein